MQKLSLFLVLCLVAVIWMQHLGYRSRLEKERQNAKQEHDRTLAVDAFNNAGPMLSILEALRAGNTNAATAQLESKLYMDVYNMHYFYKQLPEQRLDATQRDLLVNIRAYGQRYPIVGYNPPVDRLTVEMLSLTNAPTTK